MSLRRLIRVRLLWAGLVLGFLAGGPVAIVRAADEEKVFTPGASRSESPASAAGASVNTVTLVVGLALAGVGGWLLWRNRRATPLNREARALAIDETRSLGNRQFLVVASYEGKKFLLGVCPGRIDLLSPLDGTPAKERARE